MTEGTPERGLASAVIKQAIMDACKMTIAITPMDKDEARRFLTSEEGAWKRSRDEWASHAGLSGDMVREEALRMIELCDAGINPLAGKRHGICKRGRDGAKRESIEG